MRYYMGLLALLLLLSAASTTATAQSFLKRITVKVTDASNGRPIAGAQVKLKGLVTTKNGVTNDDGIASFEWLLLGSEADIKIDVTESYAHYPFRSSFTITQGQDDYIIPASLTSSMMRFDVRVTDSRNGQPLKDATVTVQLADAKHNSGYTDGYGNVVLDVQVLSRFPALNIEARKDGYATTVVNVPLSDKVGLYPVAISMNRDQETRFLKVTVLDEKQQPITDATVSAGASTLAAVANGSTDASGVAMLICKVGGNYSVSVSHDNFERTAGEISITKYGQQQEYALTFVLKRKRALLRNLTVIVKEGASANDKVIANAFVDAGNASGITNSSGQAHLNNVVALGETGKLSVVAHGYEETKMMFIGGGDNYRYSPPIEDKVYVYLKKSKARDVKLIVQVLDKSTDRPIGKASVSIENKKGTMIASGRPTNVKGEAETMLSKSEWDNVPLRVMAKANGYLEQWSDIYGDFLNTENDPLFYTVFLEKKPADMMEGEKRYGPFDVGLREWVGTGIQLKKNQSFRVSYDTTSKITYTNASGQEVRMWPDGHGYWGWFVLAAKVNADINHVGSRGGGMAKEEGQLMLGAPRVAIFYPEDGKDASGSWRVYVYVKEK